MSHHRQCLHTHVRRDDSPFLVCCPKTVSSLKDPSKRVNTKEAIIILISDFGRDEIRTGDSWDEIAEKVHRETKVPRAILFGSFWGQADNTSSRAQAILQEDLMVQRIQYHIPFAPVPDLNCTARVGKVRVQHHRHRLLAT